ncbi:MAG: hypothetical protein ACRDQE_04035 [Gaiellales bacterium]
MLGACGIMAGVLQALFYVPYIRDIVSGSTRPHRGTWAIWCALSVIVLASQRADGGRWSLLVVVAQLVGAATISALAIKRGVGGTSRLDLCLAAIAIAGLIGWYVAGNPTLATLGVVVADAVAVVMMVPKTYRYPYSETLSAFVLSAFSGLFAMAAVGGMDVGLLLYPTYFVAADLALIALIGLRRREIATRP